MHLLIKAKKKKRKKERKERKEKKILKMTLQSPFFNEGLSPNGNKLAILLNYNFIPDLHQSCLKVWNIL